MVREEPLGHLVGGRPAADQRPCGLDDVPAPAVVEGDGQRHPPVVGGQRRQVVEVLGQFTGDARVGDPEETAADAAREQQRRMLAHNPAHQTHQEFDLGARAVPVLGGEGVQAEPLHAGGPGRLDDVDDGGLRGPVTRRTGKRTPLRPTAVAVHHAGHVPRPRTRRPLVPPLPAGSATALSPARPVLRHRECARDAVVPHVRPRPVRSGTTGHTALGHAHPASPLPPRTRPTGAFPPGSLTARKGPDRPNEWPSPLTRTIESVRVLERRTHAQVLSKLQSMRGLERDRIQESANSRASDRAMSKVRNGERGRGGVERRLVALGTRPRGCVSF